MAKKRWWIVEGMPFHFGSLLGPWVVSDETKRELARKDPSLRFRLKKEN